MSATPYARGEWVQYSSSSREAWLDAQVRRVHHDGSLTLHVKTPSGTTERIVRDHMVRRKDRGPMSPSKPRRDVALTRATTASGTQYQVGQQVEYSSDSREAWVPATVEALLSGGRARLRLYTGAVYDDVGTHLMRHRSAREILREAEQERRRKEAARRALEEERRRLEQDAAELRALEAKAKQALKQKQAALKQKPALPVGGAAGPRPGGSTRWRLGERLWYHSRSKRRDIRARVEVLHSNSDISIRRDDGIEQRLTLTEARDRLHR
jgi:hypothetical protein